MKLFLMSFFSIASISTTAMADELAKQCYSKAASVAENFASGNYDEDGFWAYECALASNKKAVICEVGASKGDGAATDTYRVVLNKTCTKAFRVELTGEE
ncbi:hypothetical protein [Bdellovibrio bacteriovorus]|uniref:hypothetical protein n=1 Tax=Bdellovibrio bacteriovorus TaxID=959 RepID=UPI0035A92972